MRPEPSTAYSLCLASSSPRRRLLLESAGFGVTVYPPAVDESAGAGERPARYVARIALAKHADVAARGLVSPSAPVLAADTVVALRRDLLGKPADRQDAEHMLCSLSEVWHEVITGVAVGRPGQEPASFTVRTRVRFKRLRKEEIAWYLGTGEWQDKAGGYGIQGRGAFLVAGLEGSYTNVVGLPLAEVVDALAGLGVAPDPGQLGATRKELLQ